MQNRSTPVHLVCGPLGIGKTTAIIQYLKRHADTQFVAVLVNDFGPVGLDAAIMEGDIPESARQKTSLKMLPGGCVCCTSAASLIGAMEQLAALPRVDRIIIEPSGLALVGDMVDVVASVAGKYGLQLRPVITLIEPRLLDRPGFLLAPCYVRMVEAADVLVANRCDLASAEQIARLDEWAAGLYPPKLRVVKTTHGQIPDEVFELEEVPTRAPVPAHPAGKPAHAADQYAGGCTFPAETVFDTDQVEHLLQQLAIKGIAGNEVLRLKAILHTQEGWRLYEIARGDNHCRPTDYRRDNRVDWITQGVPILDEVVKAMLDQCRALPIGSPASQKEHR